MEAGLDSLGEWGGWVGGGGKGWGTPAAARGGAGALSGHWLGAHAGGRAGLDSLGEAPATHCCCLGGSCNHIGTPFYCFPAIIRCGWLQPFSLLSSKLLPSSCRCGGPAQLHRPALHHSFYLCPFLQNFCHLYAGAVELRNSIARRFCIDPPATLTFDHPTIAALAGYLAQQQAGAAAGHRAFDPDAGEGWAQEHAGLLAGPRGTLVPWGARGPQQGPAPVASELVAVSGRYPSPWPSGSGSGPRSSSGGGSGFWAGLLDSADLQAVVPLDRWDMAQVRRCLGLRAAVWAALRPWVPCLAGAHCSWPAPCLACCSNGHGVSNSVPTRA